MVYFGSYLKSSIFYTNLNTAYISGWILVSLFVLLLRTNHHISTSTAAGVFSWNLSEILSQFMQFVTSYLLDRECDRLFQGHF